MRRSCLTKECEISFSNTATKLTEVQVHRLFDRFYTVENARESTGLGLSISRVLAEKSGGEISADRLIITQKKQAYGAEESEYEATTSATYA